MTDPDLLTARLRTGRRVPQNLYAQLGEEPSDEDPSVGWAKTPEIARQAVRAVNEDHRLFGASWWCAGCLIYDGPVYDGPGERLTSDWIIAVASEDLAERIADAANGVTDG